MGYSWVTALPTAPEADVTDKSNDPVSRLTIPTYIAGAAVLILLLLIVVAVLW